MPLYGKTPLPWSYAQRDGGLRGDGSTDDTTAFQAWITSVTVSGTKSGWFFFEPGTYLIGGALQDTGAFNGQILLPSVSTSSAQISLHFQGAARPPFEYVGTFPAPGGYSIIKSTLTGASGTASCISGGNGAGDGVYNNITVVLEDLIFVAPDNPTFSMICLVQVQGGAIRGVQIATTGAFAGSPVQPTNSNAYGIKLPQIYNSNYTESEALSVGSFYTQVLDGELAIHKGLILSNGIYGIEEPAAFYPSVIYSVTSTGVQKVIRGTGTHYLDVHLYVAEHATTPAWRVTTYDVDDASNYINGDIRWLNAAVGGAIDHSFIKNGATNVRASEMLYSSVTDATISTSDITTNNVSTSKHGFTPKGDNNAAHFLNGQLGWTTPAGGSVATDTIWDAAGDLAVGTGADTAAKLVKGNAGGTLAMGNSAVIWNAGTSFPASKATSDRYHRTDLGGEWYWDGAQWVRLVPEQLPFPCAVALPLTTTAAVHRMNLPQALGGSDVYLYTITIAYYVDAGTALSGSHKWDGQYFKTGGATSTSLGTSTINSGASSQWLAAPAITINAAASSGSYVALEGVWTKTGTPGNLYVNAMIAVRSLAT